MYYTLISSHDDNGDGCHRLFFGTLKQIAHKLSEHCYESLREALEDEDLSIADLEDEYSCNLDSYIKLIETDNPDEDLIRGFDFDFSGARVYVIALTTTYADLADAFNAYAPGTYLDPWRMRSGSYIFLDTLQEIDRDLVALPTTPTRYFYEDQ